MRVPFSKVYSKQKCQEQHAKPRNKKLNMTGKEKALQRRERRFTKPLKLFLQGKYPVIYEEYIKFFSNMESEYPAKKDLTKTEMFNEFLSKYPVEICTVEVLETSSETPVQTTTSSETPVQTTTSSETPVQTTISLISEIVNELFGPAQAATSSETPVQTTTSSETPVQTTTSSETPVQTTTSLLSDIVDEIFGPGNLDQYIDHVENMDEGIDLNILDELKFDLEDFDFELETVDF